MDLILGILYGMRLRCAGESQQSNVIELTKTVSQITQPGHRPVFATNRGYIHKDVMADPTVAQFETVGICSDSSRNPFLASDRIED